MSYTQLKMSQKYKKNMAGRMQQQKANYNYCGPYVTITK